MPKLEKIISVGDAILAILAEIGTIHIKAFFPHPYYHTFCNHKSKSTFYSTLSHLKKRKLVNHNKDKQIFSLTPLGKKETLFVKTKVKTAFFTQSNSPKKEKWDGYWRVVIFDIPEKLITIRNALRDLLKGIGFQKLQHSVWVYPYKIPDFLDETLNDNRIKKYVRFLLVKEIYYDWDIKKNFFNKADSKINARAL